MDPVASGWIKHGADVRQELSRAEREDDREGYGDDGEIITGYGGVISNCACYGGPFKISPGASLSNKSLELVLFKKRSKLAMMVNALKVGSGVGLSGRDAWQTRFTSATVSGQGLPFQIDGDEYTDEDQEVRVLPEWLRMVLPENRS